jgi:hypothetical protein
VTPALKKAFRPKPDMHTNSNEKSPVTLYRLED